MPFWFADLPSEVVELIFGFLDEKDRRSLALMSKAIYKIFQQYEELNTVDLSVTMDNNFHQMDEKLNRYPNLKRLHLSFMNESGPQWNLAEFREFVDNWCTQLEEIEVSTSFWSTEQLLKAFEEWNNEKLTFDYVELCLVCDNMEIIKWFFSYPRRIKHLVALGLLKVLDKDIFDIINQNAIIERLEVLYLPIQSNSIPNVFFNMNGVKEIGLLFIHLPVDSGNFTPKALLKVTTFTDCSFNDEEEPLYFGKFDELPQFQNLRKLALRYHIIDDKDTELVFEKFLNLEEIFIHVFLGSGGTLFSPLRKLKKIHLCNAGRLTDEDLIVGFNLPNLKSLAIGDTKNVTLTGIKGLMANCPKLEEFQIYGEKIDDVCKAYIEENLCKPEPK